MLLKELSRGLWAPAFLALSVTACGPVKFSAPSSSTDVQTDGTVQDNGQATTDTITLRDVHYSNLVTATNNKLDIVLVVDDSNSMLPDNRKLAQRLSPFVSRLQQSQIDWQMCATVTRALPVGNNTTAWGASIYWQKNSTASTDLGMVLRQGTGIDLNTIFNHTFEYIGAGWANTDDERGIKAAYRHVYNGDYHYNPNSGCYRQDSAIAFIIISDEDERSVGGDSSQQFYASELKPLENEDRPQYFVNFVRSTFGSDRRFTVNSIIVKPGDTACKTSQDSNSAKSHYGFKYAALSNLTGGGIGSICATDYSTNMNLFIDRITDSLSSVPLECVPAGSVSVTITPNIGTVSSRVEGMNLVFDTVVPAGHNVDIRYQCANDSRSPSSVKGQPIQTLAEGIFASIINFFRNLF